MAAAADSVFTEERREALRARLNNLSFRINLVRKVVQRAGSQALPNDFDCPRPLPPNLVINLFSGIKVNLTIASNWVFNMKLTKQNSSLLSFIFGTVFVATLLIVNMAIPDPTPTQWETFRIILAIAAGGVGAMIPGFLNVQVTPSAKFAISAGGALAVFVIVYFFHPGLPLSISPGNPLSQPAAAAPKLH